MARICTGELDKTTRRNLEALIVHDAGRGVEDRWERGCVRGTPARSGSHVSINDDSVKNSNEERLTRDVIVDADTTMQSVIPALQLQSTGER